MDKLSKDVEDLNKKLALVLLESKVAEEKVKEMEGTSRQMLELSSKLSELDDISKAASVCTDRIEKLEGRISSQQLVTSAQLTQLKTELEKTNQSTQDISTLKKEIEMIVQSIASITEDLEETQNSIANLSSQLKSSSGADIEELKKQLEEKFASSKSDSTVGDEFAQQIEETRQKLTAMDALWVDVSERLKEFSNQQEAQEKQNLQYVTQSEVEESISQIVKKEVDKINIQSTNLENSVLPENYEKKLEELESTYSTLTKEIEKGKDIEKKLNSLSQMVEDLEKKGVPCAPSAPPSYSSITMGESEDLFENPQPDKELGFELDDLLQVMIKHQASDLHLKGGAPPTVRLEGDLVPVGGEILSDNNCSYLVVSGIPKNLRKYLAQKKEIDFAYSIPEARFRVNAFLQKGSVSASYRMLKTEIPSIENLRLPTVLKKLVSINNGLILVTGPAGSGKSTTLASLVDHLNTTKKLHIVTIEDPIEYVHTDKMSLVTQREVGTDTPSFLDAIRASLRQDPNVILIGEMRDPETIFTATIAAETGHLVMSTLHTPNTVQAIQRIIDEFSGEQQKQFRLLLSSTLKGVVSQRLLNRQDGAGRVPAVEIMIVTPTISSLISENKLTDIYPLMVEGKVEGMQTFTHSLTELVESGIISKEDALFHAEQRTEFRLGVEGHTTGTAATVQEDSLMSWL